MPKKNHLSRVAAPKSWPIKRKGIKWVTKPRSGPHPLRSCLPLSLVMKNLLKSCKTLHEVKRLLNAEQVLVDKIARKDPKFPVGVMDVIEIPMTKEHYRVLFDKNGKFFLRQINKNEANLKPCKIISKKMLKGNKLQINLYDSKNIMVDNNDYKVNDTLIIDLSKLKSKKPSSIVRKHLKFEKGAAVYITEGKQIGVLGKLEDIKSSFSSSTIIIRNKDKQLETAKDYAFVVDASITFGENHEKDSS